MIMHKMTTLHLKVTNHMKDNIKLVIITEVY